MTNFTSNFLYFYYRPDGLILLDYFKVNLGENEYFMSKNNSSKQFQFNVIAGFLKGKVIKAPDLGITRPPLSRIRKSIFDFLNPYLVDATYLDLFSGTGSYLFEAISRGAQKAYGVELEPKLAESINLQAKKYNIENSLVCYSDDVLDAIPKFYEHKKKFDIIMIAPPQYKKIIDETLKSLANNPIVHEDSVILCQHDTSEKNINFQNFEILQQRKYGNTTFTILKGLGDN